MLGRGGVLTARALGTLRVAVPGRDARRPRRGRRHGGRPRGPPSWGAALPLLVGNVALALVSLGFLGGIGVSGFGRASGDRTVFDASGWLWLVVLLVVLTAVVPGWHSPSGGTTGSAPRWTGSSPPPPGSSSGWSSSCSARPWCRTTSPVQRAVSGAGSVGVAPWTPVVFALWGAAIEVVARYLAPVCSPGSAAAVLLVTARLVGSDPRPVPAWGAGVGPAPAAGAGAAVPRVPLCRRMPSPADAVCRGCRCAGMGRCPDRADAPSWVQGAAVVLQRRSSGRTRRAPFRRCPRGRRGCSSAPWSLPARSWSSWWPVRSRPGSAVERVGAGADRAELRGRDRRW